MKQDIKHYFLGCTTAAGFFGCFDSVAQPQSSLRPYLIKAGPGCGKSSMMRRLAGKLQELDFSPEYIHCGSDPASLDGILCSELGISLLDATAPHTIDPSLPVAAQQVVSLYDCLDEEKLLPHKEALLSLQTQHGSLMKRVRRLIGAAASLYEEVFRTAAAALQKEKLARYLQGLCSRELPRTGRKGSEQFRLCTNFTPDGFADFRSGNFSSVRRIIFCDKWGAMSSTALGKVREYALAAGYDVVSCLDPLAPETRLTALWLPQLQLCFMADGAFGRAPREGAKLVHAARFYGAELLKVQRAKLNFALRAAAAVADEACRLMQEARELHTAMEQYYIKAMDFEKLSQKESALFEQILRRSSV